MKALVVDDDEMIRRLVAKVIEQETTFEVIGEAASGHEALEILGRQQVDLVITDLEMPGMSGVDLTREITARYPGTHVLALTSVDDAASREAMRAAGASGFIVKGDDISELVYALRRSDPESAGDSGGRRTTRPS